jgi:VWFA-related protein
MRTLGRIFLAAAIGVSWAALLIPALGATAQAPADDLIITYVAPVEQDQAERVNKVRATFSVLDAQRQPVTGLITTDFNVSLSGQPIDQFEISTPQDPTAVILVIDTSGSMSGRPLEQAKDAARQFVDTLGAQDEIAVFSFNLTVTNHTGSFTTDRNAIKNLLGSPKIAVPKRDQWTCLYDAMYDAVTLATQRPPGRRAAIVVLSDGADIGPGRKQCSTHNVNEVIAKATGTKVPIYTIGLGGADRATLEKIAGESGGNAVISPRPGDLAAAFQNIGHLLRDQYLLAFNTDEEGSKQLLIGLKSNTAVADDEQIVLQPLPPPPPLSPPHVTISSTTQIINSTFMFTASIQPSPKTNAPVTDIRWYADNVLQAIITDTQRPDIQLAYNFVDSAGKCLTGTHEARVEATDSQRATGQDTRWIEIKSEVCPPQRLAISLIGAIGIGVALLLAVVGLVFVIARRPKQTVVYGGDNLSEETEEAAEDMGTVIAHLTLMGGIHTADGRTEVDIRTDSFKIGRSQDNDLPLDDSKISRKHADIRFSRSTRAFTIHDLGSANGTKVNSEFFKAASRPLPDNAHIEIGRATILFVIVNDAATFGIDTTDEDRTEAVD